jgi:hypothetical protein
VQIHRYGYGIKGFGRFSDYGLRFLAMVSDKAQQRYRALLFWEKYGLDATMEAFKVKRRTLYYWRKQLSEGNEVSSRSTRSPGRRASEASGCGPKKSSKRSADCEKFIPIWAREALPVCEDFL